MGRIHVQNVLNEPISSFLYVIVAKTRSKKAEMISLTDHRRSVYICTPSGRPSRHDLSAYGQCQVKITECRVLGGQRSHTSV